MVHAGAQHVGGHVDAPEIDGFPQALEDAGLHQFVLQVQMAQVGAEHGAGQVGAVRVPVQQVEGRRGLALQVVAHHIVPDQLVGPQEVEGERQILAGHDAPLADGAFSQGQLHLVDEDAQHARMGGVQQRGEQRERGSGFLALGGQHSQRGAQQRAADAEAQQVDGRLTADGLHDVDGIDDALLQIVVPAQRAVRILDVAPRDDKDGVSLGNGMADEGIAWLQVQDVVLVDGGRDDQQRPFTDRGRAGLVLDELDELVLVDDGAGGRADVAADLEGIGWRLRDAALLQVVQQVLDALAQALALGLDHPLLGIRIGGQEVGG